MKKNVNRFIELSRIDAPKISLQERKNEFKEIYSKQEPQEVKQQAALLPYHRHDQWADLAQP